MLREKLLSGKLKKHSEQLNKFVAGFFDTDGCVGIVLDKRWLKVYAKITQAASKDPDFEIMRALQKHYNIGYISLYIPENENSASVCDWILNISDSQKLFNIIGKHLLVKHCYYIECIKTYKEFVGVQVDQQTFEEIKIRLAEIKSQSKFPKIPKHLSWSYTAGVLSGDGHYRCKFSSKENELNVELYNNSEQLVQAFCQSFRGTYRQKGENCFKWRRNLGKNSRTFAEYFLPRIRKYTLLKTKRDVIDRMLNFHQLPAETKQDDLYGN